jgi:hypothetical protein
MRELVSLPIFRFNIDLWRDYRWSISQEGYLLQDPTGRSCCSAEVRAVYLRKLIFSPPLIDLPAAGSEDAWCREEVLQIWHGIHDLALEAGRLALVQPSPLGRWTKMRQMWVAQHFFRVPRWEMFHGVARHAFESTVVKTQGTQLPGGGGMVMVRTVDVQQLSPGFPWFVQQHVLSATYDVTVVYVNGKSFAFECSRDQFAGPDCRIPTGTGEAKWHRCRLTPAEDEAVQSFMRATGHSFGRLDFLRDNAGLWFLELNPNGQFAWLDLHGAEGLLKAVAAEIRAVYYKK